MNTETKIGADQIIAKLPIHFGQLSDFLHQTFDPILENPEHFKGCEEAGWRLAQEISRLRNEEVNDLLGYLQQISEYFHKNLPPGWDTQTE